MSTRRRLAAHGTLAVAALAIAYGTWRARGGRARTPLPVEYAGCAAVLAGPACVPGAERRLTVFVASGAAARVSGARLAGEPVHIQSGQRLQLALRPEAERLEIEAEGRHWSLALAREQVPAWSDDLRALLRSGQVDAAAELARGRLADGPASEQGRALAALARIELRRGNRGAAAPLLRRAVADHRLRARALELADDATVLVYTLLFHDRRLDEARALLASLPDGDELPAEARYYREYYGGLLAVTTGDLRSALRSLGQAAERAERLGLTRLQRAAEQVLAEPLQLLGRRAEAEALLERLTDEAPADLPDCERAQLQNALGWNRLLVRELGESGPDPRPVLEQAVVRLGRGCAHLPDEALNVALNLVLAQLQAGDTRAARADLESAPVSAAPPLHVVLWRREIEARLDLAEGHAQRALHGFERLARLADATLAWGARWRAAVGRARALRDLGRVREALAAYAQAEDRLDHDTLQVPLHEGRETFVASHERATRAHLDLLLAQGRVSEAWTLARRSRARVVSAVQRGARLASLSPEERQAWDAALSEYRARRDALATESAQDWSLSAERLRQLSHERQAVRRRLDELLDRAFALLDHGRAPGRASWREPREGELLLAYHPLPRGEAAFAADARGVTVVRSDCLARERVPAELAACLLGPFAERVRAARAVTLLPFGAFGRIDFHALPFDGAPLAAGRDVAWSLDLAARPEAPSGERPLALLVGDARGDLPAARAELHAVSALLPAGSWRVQRREGSAATWHDVRRALADAELFHFAGHGEYAGHGGWDSALPLADGAALGPGDVLALERAPRLAVLSGCETGRSSNEAAEALGLAQAFASRGSHAVVAATRPVGDAATGHLMTQFYRRWSQGDTPAAALRAAQLALRERDPGADWAAFRLLTP